jgi:hypothetical protein
MNSPNIAKLQPLELDKNEEILLPRVAIQMFQRVAWDNLICVDPNPRLLETYHQNRIAAMKMKNVMPLQDLAIKTGRPTPSPDMVDPINNR